MSINTINNDEPKSHENLSDGELFVLEKTTEIILAVHKKLNSLGISGSIDPDYCLKISQEVYNKLPDAIIKECKLSRQEKGKITIDNIKNTVKEKTTQEIEYMDAHLGDTGGNFKKDAKKELSEFIADLDIYPLTNVMKNLAWTVD